MRHPDDPMGYSKHLVKVMTLSRPLSLEKWNALKSMGWRMSGPFFNYMLVFQELAQPSDAPLGHAGQNQRSSAACSQPALMDPGSAAGS